MHVHEDTNFEFIFNSTSCFCCCFRCCFRFYFCVRYCFCNFCSCSSATPWMVLTSGLHSPPQAQQQLEVKMPHWYMRLEGTTTSIRFCCQDSDFALDFNIDSDSDFDLNRSPISRGSTSLSSTIQGSTTGTIMSAKVSGYTPAPTAPTETDVCFDCLPRLFLFLWLEPPPWARSCESAFLGRE